VKFILVVLLMAIPSASLASDWHLAWIIKSPEQSALIFVDAETLHREGKLVRYWKDEWMDPPLGRAAVPFNRLRTLVEADCLERKFRSLANDAYYDEKPTLSLGAIDWSFAGPDTANDHEIQKVCSRAWTKDAFDPSQVAKTMLSDLKQSGKP
jgi:hypothetical protein